MNRAAGTDANFVSGFETKFFYHNSFYGQIILCIDVFGFGCAVKKEWYHGIDEVY